MTRLLDCTNFALFALPLQYSLFTSNWQKPHMNLEEIQVQFGKSQTERFSNTESMAQQ